MTPVLFPALRRATTVLECAQTNTPQGRPGDTRQNGKVHESIVQGYALLTLAEFSFRIAALRVSLIENVRLKMSSCIPAN